jgi:hypothetical protein
MGDDHLCMCCYCESKGTPDNAEYIRGIKFAVQFVQDEWASRKEGVDRWRASRAKGDITDRTMKNRVDHLEHQMRYLGQWHDILAKEGNKAIKLIKDIDWEEYLYGDHGE